jgi:hypothetical protein
MKITCTCGIDYSLYDYPPTEVEVEGKTAMERLVMCPCDREYVIHTQPKYEPDSKETNVSGVMSFEELVKKLKAPPPAPKAASWGPPQSAKKVSSKAKSGIVLPGAADASGKASGGLIIDPNAIQAAPAVAVNEKSIFLTQDDADVVSSLIANYGAKFKDAEMQKEEVQEFADLASRAKQEGMFTIGEKEQRMVRMAFLEKNILKLWPFDAYADETEFNVQQTAKAKLLREKFKQMCGWDK